MSDLEGAILDPLPTIKGKIEHHLGTFPNIQFHKKNLPIRSLWVFPIFFQPPCEENLSFRQESCPKELCSAQEKFSFAEK